MERGVPSVGTVRSSRSLHLSQTCRSAENKELAKLKGEDFGHCKIYKAALRLVEERHPDVFTDTLRLWNMDETTVTAEYGQMKKIFFPGASNHGGFCVSTIGSGGRRHISADIAGLSPGACRSSN